MTIRYYCGAKIFHNNELLENCSLVVKKDKVIDVIDMKSLPDHAPTHTLNGGVISPGFVETQANGGGGVLVNDDFSHEGLAKVISAHRQFGTVAILPTFITDQESKYHLAIKNIADGVKIGLKGLVGGHFEGPFLNSEKKGTHNSQFIRQPNENDLDCYKQNADYLQHSIISLAPEELLKGTISKIKPFVPQINMAHSMATRHDLVLAKQEGLTGITHLYNAMRPMTGREPGPIGSASELELACGIITDGIHSHPYSLSTAYKNIGEKHLMLVTDSMHTIGAPNIKSFDLMGIKVSVEGDRLVNEEGNLAGAHINMLDTVKNAMCYMHIDIGSALSMAVNTPACYVGRPDLASVVNRDISDVIYLNDELKLINWY